MNKPIIEIRDLTRIYKHKTGILKKENRETVALNKVNFSIGQGEIFTLIGPNGAGKTTTVKILSTLLAPTEGYAKIFGFDTFKEAGKIRPRINFIFGDERSLYWRLSAKDNLDYFADLYKIDSRTKKKRIPELVELVGLTSRLNDKVETFSKGMKQRLQIARGLINDPEVIFLDEPTSGLDPIAAKELREMIKHMKTLGKTILLTTHDMLEADSLSDRIAIIDKGKILALDAPEILKNKYSSFSIIDAYFLNLDKHEVEQIKGINGVMNCINKSVDNLTIITIQCNDQDIISKKISEIIDNKKIIKITHRTPLLEDVYINLVGNQNAI